MRDSIYLAQSGFRQRLGTYLVMALLVAFTVAGYLVVDSYWKDAAEISTEGAEPLNFRIKSHVVHAYLSTHDQRDLTYLLRPESTYRFQ